MVLVANKVDLVHLRKVTSDQGQEMAAKHSVSVRPSLCTPLPQCKSAESLHYFTFCLVTVIILHTSRMELQKNLIPQSDSRY